MSDVREYRRPVVMGPEAAPAVRPADTAARPAGP